MSLLWEVPLVNIMQLILRSTYEQKKLQKSPSRGSLQGNRWEPGVGLQHLLSKLSWNSFGAGLANLLPHHFLVTFCMFRLSFETGLLHSVLPIIRKVFVQVEPFQFNSAKH